MKNTFCSFCGIKFTEQIKYPRKCFACYNETFSNPVPVSITLLAAYSEGDKKPGALVQKRNIDPQKGSWALHGGYLESHETWQQGAVRELKEELNLDLDSKHIVLMDILSASNGNLLIFNYIGFPIHIKNIPFVPNNEVSEIKIVHEPIELAFPIHNEMLKRFFNKQINWMNLKFFNKCF